MSLNSSRQSRHSNSSVIIDIEPEGCSENIEKHHEKQHVFDELQEKLQDKTYEQSSVISEAPAFDVARQDTSKTNPQLFQYISKTADNDMKNKGRSYRRNKKRRRVETKNSSKSSNL